MTMLEKVAREIRLAMIEYASHANASRSERDEHRKLIAEHFARAALEALREPTEGMVSVGGYAYLARAEDDLHGDVAVKVWAAMLDEAVTNDRGEAHARIRADYERDHPEVLLPPPLKP